MMAAFRLINARPFTHRMIRRHLYPIPQRIRVRLLHPRVINISLSLGARVYTCSSLYRVIRMIMQIDFCYTLNRIRNSNVSDAGNLTLRILPLLSRICSLLWKMTKLSLLRRLFLLGTLLRR